MTKNGNRRGQASLFVILAIIIVGLIVVFFVFRDRFTSTGDIPAEFLPVYSAYEECIKSETQSGLSLLGTQGGRIELGDYELGSDYAPFGSHLYFLGSQVKYWFYMTGNGLIKEDVPSKSDMERELAGYLEENVNANCDLDEFYEQGFYIDYGEPSAKVRINDNSVNVNFEGDLSVSRGGDSVSKKDYGFSVDSKLGKFYDLAVDVYNKEQEDLFLEEYGVDVLRSYAPVDGVEIQCAPKVWNAAEVVGDIREGLQANIASIKTDGSYYSLSSNEDEYFVVDVKSDERVGMMYSEDWPSKIEVTEASNGIMIAEPIGNQEGLGVMGFCYVPYHFVYDVSFPVMIQVGDGTEIFQFPTVVIIDNNIAREADYSLLIENNEDPEFDACEYKEGSANVYVYDNNLNPVDAEVKYKCLDSICDVGETEREGSSSVVRGEVPLCVNGYLMVSAEGYADKSQLFSSNRESSADVILDREYDVNVEVKVDGSSLKNGERAIVHFIGESGSESFVAPDSEGVSLQEGAYDVEVYVYGDSNLKIPAFTKTECVEVAKGGIFSLFGSKEEECYDIDIPETTLEEGLIGGGKETTYILESELSKGNIEINVHGLPEVSSVEQLQYNYAVFDAQGVDLIFR